MVTATTSVSVAREPRLLGQTVVVIGGSAGIGFETARLARSQGADVVLTGRDPKRLEQVARDLGARCSVAFDADDAAGA
jgi:NADP-dependent 3-hydroxy acid dehydrogenase YdfG